MSDVAEGFPSPDDFPSFDDVDSRSIIDPEGSFDEGAADFNAEPEEHGEES